MLDTSVRLLRLLSLLQTRPQWSGAELAARLEVTGRTVRNDVERLRILGYRVSSSTGVTGGYRLSAGSAVPPLLLDDDEAVAVALGLAGVAAGPVTGMAEHSVSALAKLRQTLPGRLRRRVDALRAATVSVAAGGPAVDPDVLTAVAAAARDHEQLRFGYRGHDGAAADRRVEPHRLVHTGRRWYLMGWDVDRADWRTFRADRIALRSPNGPRFVPREPPVDAASHVLRGVGVRAWRHSARVRVHAPAAVVAERIPATAGVITALDERTCLLESGGESLLGLAAFLGALEEEFTVLDPPDLIELLRVLAGRYGRASSGRD